ncbi:MAG: hypothetical protein JJU29_11025 [Verrucomicrobia bacterium]|nr:hypothetical protein [Verrucomicrobiota bacterium]MCH8510034.1 hypothetical protein [Kiritimatiellia bacterium]
MKAKCVLMIAMLSLFSLRDSAHAESPRPSPEDDTISITVDDVPLMDIVRIFARFAHTEFFIDAQDALRDKRVTFSVDDQPWQPVLRGLLS